MFFIIGIFISVFLLLLLLIKKHKSRADKILAFWLLFIFINQLLYYFKQSGDMYEYPHWFGVSFPMPVINGVFLYFYVMEITGNQLKEKWIIGLHLIPALSLVLLAIPFYILTGVEKIFVFKNNGLGFEWYVMYSDTLVPLSGLVYSIWSLFVIKKYRLKIQDRFSNTDKKELQWLKYLSIGFIIIWVLSIFFGSQVIYSAVVLLVLFIGFFGINQLNIFYSNMEHEQHIEDQEFSKMEKEHIIDTVAVDSQVKKYAKSGLNHEMASEIYANLNKLVRNIEIYKTNDLTLAELSRQLQIHPNHLSQVINEMEGKNFYNYINALRIKEFIKLASLPENKKYTMISLAYDCGFGTKSTFNKHFKIQTGKTPTEFFSS